MEEKETSERAEADDGSCSNGIKNGDRRKIFTSGRWRCSGKQSGGSNLLSLNFQGIEGVEAVVSPNFPHLRIGQGLGTADWADGSSWLIGPSGLVRPTGGIQRAGAERGRSKRRAVSFFLPFTSK